MTLLLSLGVLYIRCLDPDWGGLEPINLHCDQQQGWEGWWWDGVLPLLRPANPVWGLHPPQCLPRHRLRLS